jgi:hypothetical protein
MGQDEQDPQQENTGQELHHVATVAEVLGFLVDVGAEFMAATVAGTAVTVLGMFLDGFATVVGAAAQTITADNFFAALAPAQRNIFDYCAGCSMVIQGTTPQGATFQNGANLGQQILGRMNDEQRNTAQSAPAFAFYQAAFQNIRQPTIDRLISLQTGGMFGNAVPNADGWATAVVDAAAAGGTAYQGFVQEILNS